VGADIPTVADARSGVRAWPASADVCPPVCGFRFGAPIVTSLSAAERRSGMNVGAGRPRTALRAGSAVARARNRPDAVVLDRCISHR
jgi:hypothetical protein